MDSAQRPYSTYMVLFEHIESRHQSLQDSADIKSQAYSNLRFDHLIDVQRCYQQQRVLMFSRRATAGPVKMEKEGKKRLVGGAVASQILQELRHGSE